MSEVTTLLSLPNEVLLNILEETIHSGFVTATEQPTINQIWHCRLPPLLVCKRLFSIAQSAAIPKDIRVVLQPERDNETSSVKLGHEWTSQQFFQRFKDQRSRLGRVQALRLLVSDLKQNVIQTPLDLFLQNFTRLATLTVRGVSIASLERKLKDCLPPGLVELHLEKTAVPFQDLSECLLILSQLQELHLRDVEATGLASHSASIGMMPASDSLHTLQVTSCNFKPNELLSPRHPIKTLILGRLHPSSVSVPTEMSPAITCLKLGFAGWHLEVRNTHETLFGVIDVLASCPTPGLQELEILDDDELSRPQDLFLTEAVTLMASFPHVTRITVTSGGKGCVDKLIECLELVVEDDDELAHLSQVTFQIKRTPQRSRRDNDPKTRGRRLRLMKRLVSQLKMSGFSSVQGPLDKWTSRTHRMQRTWIKERSKT